MTEPEGAAQPASAGQALMPRAAAPAPDVERLARWGRKRAVMVIALLMIVAQLNWSYLTYIWDGHLIIGLRLVAWLLVRTSLYNWGLASAVTLAFTAAASLACYRPLRTLFGDGPRILIPLIFYLLTPVTIATFAWSRSSTSPFSRDSIPPSCPSEAAT